MLPRIARYIQGDVWKTLQDHWKLYQKKYWNKVDDQDENLSAQEEKCDESDEDDLNIDINDGDGNDDIPEETASTMMKKEGQEID